MAAGSTHRVALDAAAVAGVLTTGHERVLEVGPGPGHLLHAVLAAHPGIVATAVDRSPVAVRRTRERNAGHVAAGRLTVHEGALAELTAVVGAAARYDVVVLVDVNVLWVGTAEREVAALVRHLDDDGTLLVVSHPPDPARRPEIAARVAATLSAAGLRVDVRTPDDPAAGVAVVARRAAGP